MDKLPPYLSQPPQDGKMLNRTERTACAVMSVVLVLLLGVASLLTPNPAGHGTHRQLGLPGCTMVTIFGIRCPGCGMTTSWAHTLNGDIEGGLRANTAGVMLCLFASLSVPFLIAMSMRGVRSRGNWMSRLAITLLFLILSISVLEWLIRMASGRALW